MTIIRRAVTLLLTLRLAVLHGSGSKLGGLARHFMVRTGDVMKNLVDVFKQKQQELENLQRQMEERQRDLDALRTALRLCAENESEALLLDSRPVRIPVPSDVMVPSVPAQAMRKFP